MRFFCLSLLFLFMACSALHQANQYYQQSDYRATLRECRQVLAQDTTFADAYLLMGKAYMALNKPDSARLAVGRAYKLQPEKEEYKKTLVSILAELAEQSSTSGNDYEAISFYKEILSLDPQQTSAREEIADLYVQTGKIDNALSAYRQALALSEDSLALAEKIVNINERIMEAEQCFQKGKQALQANQIDAAVQHLAKARELKPDSEDIDYYFHIAKGRSLYSRGGKSNLWDAIEQFGLAATQKPEKGAPHYWMGRAYHKKDREEYDNAIHEFKKAYKIEPDGPYAQEAKKRSQELEKKKKIMREFWGK